MLVARCRFFVNLFIGGGLFLCFSCGSDGESLQDSESVVDTDTGVDTDSAVDTDIGVDTDTGTDTTDGGLPDDPDLYGFANGCFALSDAQGRWLVQNAALDGFEFAAGDLSNATPFFMKASDLATYLLYDPQGGYLVSEDGPLGRETTLQSDVSTVDDSYISGAEWELQALPVPTGNDPQRYLLRHRKTGEFLSTYGMSRVPELAADLAFEPTTGCTEHPELSLDAEGPVQAQSFEDGSVWGVVETHTHILSNFGFGGGGIFHGSPFHRLGVAHALSDCRQFHGDAGRKDIFGYGYDTGDSGLNATTLLSLLLLGQLSEDNHNTAGYPDFTEWPSAPDSSTHQTQYYMWLKRAWMGGLRLVVQHATTNSVICEFMAGQGHQPVRYSCNDMVAVDRIIEETYAMERYIDAQSGGPGKGFFRIVDTPSRAREVISTGKMAVVLGIETSNLFNCFSVPRDGMPFCDEAYVVQQLDAYYERGVRVLFPVHKFDNAFSAGDGDRDFIELGNFINSGHWSNFTLEDCPDMPSVFDRGDLSFGGLNEPRDEYQSDPPNDMSGFYDNPVLTLTPYLPRLMLGGLEGDYCQNAGLTPLGEFLLRELMKRGMVIEIDHFSRRAYEQVFAILEANDYPAAGTHGSMGPDGRLYALGGISMTNFGRCRDPERKGAMLDRLRARVALIEQYGGYPAEGLGMDLNGFAGAPGPRFGENSSCEDPQEDPITYPFTSYAGDVTFTQPRVGNRDIDFNTEGLVHIGLLPELIEDVRRDAESDADLEPLFRSAEGYLRMWERSEARGAALRAKQ
ncbi:MAG: hypothetical protein QNJ97_22735 [Myxococcota bacterium]|nr:hypothetical protein [Myxococcota bacterium]